MKLREMLEAFKTYAGKGLDKTVFINPTKKEMNEFGSTLRFFIVRKGNEKNVYVFGSNLLHGEVAPHLDIDYPDSMNMIAGTADKIGKEWVMANSVSLAFRNRDDFNKVITKDWSNPYINVENFMNQFLEK